MIQKFFSWAVVISVILQLANLAFPVMIGQLIDLLSSGDWNSYLGLLAVVCVVPVLQGLLEWGKLYNVTFFSESKAVVLRTKLTNRILQVPVSFFSQSKTGEIVTRCTDDVEQIIDYERMKVEFVEHGTLLVLIGSILFLINPWLMVVVFIGGILFLFQTKLISPRFSKNYETTMSLHDRYNEYVRERLQILPFTIVSGSFKWETRKISEIVEKAKDVGKNLAKINYWNDIMLKTIEATITGIIYLLAAYFLLEQKITLGQLVIAVSFYFPLIQTLTIVSQWPHRLKKYQISSKRVGEIGELLPDNYQKGETNIPAIDRLEFRDVSFSYPGRAPLLKKINFSMERGKVLAIVGASGGGKSTISELILKFHAPTEGKILLNESVDLAELDGSHWRKRVAYSPQNSYFFSNSLMYNIMYGNEGQTPDMLSEWSKRLGIHNFVELRDNGYDSQVSNDSPGFSGGQKQRISLLRTLLRSNLDILIVDEPTSALDYISEKKIMSYVFQKKNNCAVLIIAHRLSTIVHADTIAVLTDGQIVESGTHQELLELKGEYWRLFEIELTHMTSTKEV